MDFWYAFLESKPPPFAKILRSRKVIKLGSSELSRKGTVQRESSISLGSLKFLLRRKKVNCGNWLEELGYRTTTIKIRKPLWPRLIYDGPLLIPDGQIFPLCHSASVISPQRVFCRIWSFTPRYMFHNINLKTIQRPPDIHLSSTIDSTMVRHSKEFQIFDTSRSYTFIIHPHSYFKL